MRFIILILFSATALCLSLPNPARADIGGFAGGLFDAVLGVGQALDPRQLINKKEEGEKPDNSVEGTNHRILVDEVRGKNYLFLERRLLNGVTTPNRLPRLNLTAYQTLGQVEEVPFRISQQSINSRDLFYDFLELKESGQIRQTCKEEEFKKALKSRLNASLDWRSPLFSPASGQEYSKASAMLTREVLTLSREKLAGNLTVAIELASFDAKTPWIKVKTPCGYALKFSPLPAPPELAKPEPKPEPMPEPVPEPATAPEPTPVPSEETAAPETAPTEETAPQAEQP